MASISRTNNKLQEISALIGEASVVASLQRLAEKYQGRITFSTSFGWEDQVVTHLICSNNIPIDIFTLDTGRLFPETYSVWSRTMERYQKNIKAFYPQAEPLQKLLSEKGPNLFYNSVEERKDCCYLRKVEPLNRALEGIECWITGIRREQSNNRDGMQNVEWDGAHNLVKFHPIFEWSLEEVKTFVRANNIPYNPLHDKGFVSIGCAPCTRAIQEGEDFRAGRWWWEDSSKKECGLHIHPESTPNQEGGFI